MGQIGTLFSNAWRYWESGNSPATGAHKPRKDDIIPIGQTIDDLLAMEAAERNAADDALESLIGQAGSITVPYYDSRAAGTSATINASVKSIRTGGYAAAGDGGAALYVEATGTTPGGWQSGGGRWWQLDPAQAFTVEMFGAKPLTEAQLIAAAGSVTTQITANDTAFADAMSYLNARKGGTVFARGQFYVVSKRIDRPSAVYIIGSGCGQWEPVQKIVTWFGTTLLFKGTGLKEVTFPGITSMQNSGGWRENPASPGTYFKLWSAYNANAAGTTPATLRTFSCGIMARGVRFGGIQHLRLANWCGTNGISDWGSASNASIGDDWSFGYVRCNSEYCDDYNVQMLGGWREAAHAFLITNEAPGTTNLTAGERNRMVRALFSGGRGHIVRTADRWKVTSKTATTVVIRFSAESYFASTGTIVTDAGTYTYTGTTQSSTDFTFTGCTPVAPTVNNPLVAGVLEVRHTSTGLANAEYHDVMSHGLDHSSGNRATTFGITDSKAFECSGFPLRGLKLRNYKAHTLEPVVAHLHDCSDLTWADPQLEGGGHLISSPNQTLAAAYAVAAVGETRNMVMVGDAGLDNAGVSLTLCLARSAFIQGLQLQPRSPVDDADFILAALPWKADVAVQLRSNNLFKVKRSNGAAAISVPDTGGMDILSGGALRLSGNTALIDYDATRALKMRQGGVDQFQVSSVGSVTPGADNVQPLGNGSLRWSQLYAGTATINTSDERLKQQAGPIPDEWLDAWGEVEWCRFKWNDAVEAKGDGARWHIGMIAQRVQEVFERHGLDAFAAGLLCYDEWEDEYEEQMQEVIRIDEVFDEDDPGLVIGKREVRDIEPVSVLVRKAGNSYGIRYEEAFALEAAWTRRELKRPAPSS